MSYDADAAPTDSPDRRLGRRILIVGGVAGGAAWSRELGAAASRIVTKATMYRSSPYLPIIDRRLGCGLKLLQQPEDLRQLPAYLR
jgi:precorrin-6x reductase